MTSRVVQAATSGILLICGAGLAHSTPPALYGQSAHQSPVRGDPGDLLLLAGDGFTATDTVVYVAVEDGVVPPLPGVPFATTALSGVAPVVSTSNAPFSLAVRLPEVMLANQTYALCVFTALNERSNCVRINDARPLWLSPDYAYATAHVASLPRYLKIVGRNLQPAPGDTTQVMLVGDDECYVLTAVDDHDPSTAIEHYVAKVDLPAVLVAGTYSVYVSRTGGRSWTPLMGQQLSVLPDPYAPGTFPVGANGGCAPNDGVDDTVCIYNAITAARQNGGGKVTFAPGLWDMNYSGPIAASTPVTFDGMLVPVGVSLVGAGAGSTTVRRGTAWPAAQPSFALQGSNTVSGIRFEDATVYTPSSPAATILRLGVHWWFAHLYRANDPSYVSDVVITRNVFDKPYYAITNGGLPIDHLFITYNEFGPYFTALDAGGDPNNSTQKFHIDDSVIAFNTFKPGSYVNASIGQGVIATGLGAGLRVDFSSNTADGAATGYLYDPITDAKGWRAAFFWSLRGNNERLLVSQNTATCTGDKAGDGEAIAYDGNANTFALPSAEPVLAATATSVTVAGPLLRTTPVDYFSEHWLSIAQGPGKGQVRKIVSYSNPAASMVTFTVTPAWDVPPQPGSSLATVAREYWQVYTVDNFVDQRQPLCTKLNANGPVGGVITLYGQTADSAVEGNRQYDTSGIQLAFGYSVHDADPGIGIEPATLFQSFVEVRGNIVDHEYNWNSRCTWSGIQANYAAGPTLGFPPPIEGYGISIARNTITQADGLHGGAIAFTRSWFAGPPPHDWPVIQSPLIFGNMISDVVGSPPVADPGCGDWPQRIGIHLEDSMVQRAVLHANSCKNVGTRLSDGGAGTVRVCDSAVSAESDSCECPATHE
ncbi:MAG: hypothetical protein ABI885_14865 [Gammaproteobacteria bacterium]